MHKNPVCFWELASNDAKKSVEFFKKVFEWDMQYDEKTTIFELPAGESSSEFWGGGIFTLRKSKLPFLTIYIKVDDIVTKVKKVEEAGGLIVEPILALPSGSKICLFNEPSGVTFAMLQPAVR